MAFRGTVDGVFHMQAVNEIYGRHPHSPLSWSGSHNPQPPHPDCSLPNMHAPSGMSHVHPNYLHSEHLPSRQTSQKQSKSGGGRKDSSGERGPGGQKRVARVFPRRKAGEDKRSTDTPVILTKDMLLPLFAIPLRDAAEMMGLCPTALKSVCRRLGIDRWPFQQRRGGNASTRASKNKEAKAAAQMIMNPQQHAPSMCSSSPTESSSSEHSDATTTCAFSRAEEPLELSSLPPPRAQPPSSSQSKKKPSADTQQQQRQRASAWSAVAVRSEENYAASSRANSHEEPGVKGHRTSSNTSESRTAMGSTHMVCAPPVDAWADPSSSSSSSLDALPPLHHASGSSHPHQQHEEWAPTAGAPASSAHGELFPSLFGQHVTWEHPAARDRVLEEMIEAHGSSASCDMAFLTVRI